MKYFYYTNLVFAAASLLGGCFLLDQPDQQSLGEVEINAVLQADTCGPGTVSQGATLSYDIELRREGSTLLWVGPSGTFEGNLSNDGSFCIQLSQSWHVRDADEWMGDPGCDMSQVEQLCGTLELVEDDDTDPATERVTSMTARHEVYVSNAQGTLCPELIGISQGQYLMLPCQVVYGIEGIAVE